MGLSLCVCERESLCVCVRSRQTVEKRRDRLYEREREIGCVYVCKGKKEWVSERVGV